jgi:hypothetical protein
MPRLFLARRIYDFKGLINNIKPKIKIPTPAKPTIQIPAKNQNMKSVPRNIRKIAMSLSLHSKKKLANGIDIGSNKQNTFYL